jgi:hypothetical protein
MFWRASVHDWRECKKIELGIYEEQLRSYLVGETSFPQNCVLWVSIPEKITPFVNLTLLPYGGRGNGHRRYKLVIRGVGFDLFVGSRIPAETRSTCFVANKGNPIYKSNMFEKGILQDLDLKFSRNPELLKGPAARL